MSISREYKCDLCGDQIARPSSAGFRGIGIHWIGNRKITQAVDPKDVNHHLCFYCLSSIQKIQPYCGHGFKCGGGIDCTSDHQ